jgi:predicted flap endonuclease-1-like 5' DNA nuclease
MSLVEDRITLHETAPAEQAASARRTLAQRLAQRNRLRAERAERLARLHERPGGGAGPQAAAADDDGAALEDFLRALTGGLRSEAPAVLPPPGAVLPFQRPAVDTPPEASAAPTPAPPAEAAPAAAKAPDLDRLPGAGPGLVWALERAGLHCLADLAPLAPEDLAARLGPLGHLVPAAAWIAAARRAAAEASAA